MAPQHPPPHRELGNLRRGLAMAGDMQIVKVLAVVDSLEARGSADEMIAPLRARLAQIRPRRPLRFSRLLFMPLDPLIVPAHAWDRNPVTIPRSAVPPLAETVHNAMGEDARAIDAMIRHHAVDDTVIAATAGSILWPAAAAILANAMEPASWAKTALPPDTCLPLLRRVATLLGHADALESLYAEAEIGVALQPEQLRPLLRSASAQNPDTLAMLVTLLLARLPETLGMLGRAASAVGRNGGDQLRVATQRAIEVLLDRLEAKSGVETLIVANSLGQVGAEVRHITHLLEALPKDGSCPQWHARQRAIAHRLDAICQLRLATALDVEFADALGGIAGNSDPEALGRLEDAARGLRDLEQEARRVGCPEICDTLLRRAALLVNAPGAQQTLNLVDRVRLVEILEGSEAALAMLDEALPAA